MMTPPLENTVKAIRIIRIDPQRRTVAVMMVKAARDVTPELRRMIRSSDLTQRDLLDVGGQPLMCIARRDVEEDMQGWRLRGTEDTAGIAVLTGHNAENVLIDVPVSRDWVLKRIEWLDGEDVEGRDVRADELLPALNADVERALREAVVLPTGEIWISAAHKAVVGDAMITLGLGTERTGGQLLTKLGETVHDKLVFGASRATEELG